MRAASGTGDEWRFTGEQWDTEAGLYFLRARYYEPDVGRFVSADPFPGYAQQPRTQNAYPYVWNDPVNRVDPSGKTPICPPCKLPRCPGLNDSELEQVVGMLFGETFDFTTRHMEYYHEGEFDALKLQVAGTLSVEEFQQTVLSWIDWDDIESALHIAAWTFRHRYMNALGGKFCRRSDVKVEPILRDGYTGYMSPEDVDATIDSQTYDYQGIEMPSVYYHAYTDLRNRAWRIAAQVLGYQCESLTKDPTGGSIYFHDAGNFWDSKWWEWGPRSPDPSST